MKFFLKKILFRPCIASRAARILARVHQKSYALLGPFAAASEGGLHPKHRLIQYHRYFVEHIPEGHTVLDVGCNNGALLKDIVEKTGAPAVGVELSRENARVAQETLSRLPHVEIVNSDIRDYAEKRHFDTVVLSNVLEHLDNRVGVLKHLNTYFTPGQFLIRVPMYERGWTVPYIKELGLQWRLDPTHVTEYTEDGFYAEMNESGLDVHDIAFRWGEIYAVVLPSRTKGH